MKYDLIIIGGGPAGLAAAIAAKKQGKPTFSEGAFPVSVHIPHFL